MHTQINYLKHLKNTNCLFDRREKSLFSINFLSLPIESESLEMIFHNYSEVSIHYNTVGLVGFFILKHHIKVISYWKYC